METIKFSGLKIRTLDLSYLTISEADWWPKKYADKFASALGSYIDHPECQLVHLNISGLALYDTIKPILMSACHLGPNSSLISIHFNENGQTPEQMEYLLRKLQVENVLIDKNSNQIDHLNSEHKSLKP